jgi:sirohydrochlorin ferrochelatase
VYWLGSREQTDGAIRKFDAQLAGSGQAPADVAQAVRRVNSVFEAAMESGSAWGKSTLQPALWTLRADASQTALPAPGDCVITHVEVVSIDQIAAAVKANHQTIGHWGLGHEALRPMAQATGARGVDRIVPLGKALAFDNIWDGGDLLDDFVRKVRLWE